MSAKTKRWEEKVSLLLQKETGLSEEDCNSLIHTHADLYPLKPEKTVDRLKREVLTK